MARFNPRWIAGKTVANVQLNRFDTDRGGTTTDPVITFTDGSSISFVVQETENEAGVEIIYRKPEAGLRSLSGEG